MIFTVILIIFCVFSTALWTMGAIDAPHKTYRTGCIIYAILYGLGAILNIMNLIGVFNN